MQKHMKMRKIRLYIPIWKPRFWKVEVGDTMISIQKELPLIIIAVIIIVITVIASLT